MPPRTSDAEPTSFASLIAAARGGDSDALGALIQRYRNYLLLIANQDADDRLQAKVAASDIVQESMLKAQWQFTQFHGTSDGELKAWLRTILTNDIRKSRRRFDAQRRDCQMEVNLQEHSGVGRGLSDIQMTPATDALHQERLELLRHALSHLTEDHRRVIQLRNLEGRSFGEIAISMDRSADAVRKLWARAIESLRSTLAQVAPDLIGQGD